jgi:hypothetical protein
MPLLVGFDLLDRQIVDRTAPRSASRRRRVVAGRPLRDGAAHRPAGARRALRRGARPVDPRHRDPAPRRPPRPPADRLRAGREGRLRGAPVREAGVADAARARGLARRAPDRPHPRVGRCPWSVGLPRPPGDRPGRPRPRPDRGPGLRDPPRGAARGGRRARCPRARWGRLLGYEREQACGPWIIETLARKILRRARTTVPWSSVAGVWQLPITLIVRPSAEE